MMDRHDPTSDNGGAVTRLVVFSDDWGRHPSSCQHLIRHLLDRHPTLWVNTIGMRFPRLCREDLAKIATKLREWRGGADQSDRAMQDACPPESSGGLRVVSPAMFPGFRRAWQRQLNAVMISHAVNTALGPRQAGERRIAITTIPVTADLPGRIDVDRWIYYCVDDFSVWPGLDGSVMDAMERALVGRVDAVAAVSQELQDRLAAMGADSTLITHGIDRQHWTHLSSPPALPSWWSHLPRPVALFWGVVDRRLDVDWCTALAGQGGSLVLVGPHQSPDGRLAVMPNVRMPGPVPYADLPALAAAADVLVMPYADMPVTRAIQPLKFKEYMATGKPVVVRDLPATRAWMDAADVVGDVGQFVRVVAERVKQGLPASQQHARERLANEGWPVKADLLDRLLLAA